MLDNKIVVVSGAAGLIGQNIIRAIHEAGGIGIVADVNTSRSLEIIDQVGGGGMTLEMDITSEISISQAIEKAHDRYGKVDGLINCAYPRSKSYGKEFMDVSYEDFCTNMSLHVGGYFNSSKMFGRYFSENRGGSIINFSSIYGVVAPRFQIYDDTNMTMPVEYAAIKSAIIHLTRYMARYFKGKNIRVNCVSPGGIFDGQPQSFCDAYKEYCSNTGMLDPSDINGTVLFLISDLSKQITGQNIIVDDGFSL